MKTGKYYLSKLDDEERVMFLANLSTNRDVLKTFYPTFEHFIQVAFIWKDTPQKKMYWKRISKRKIL